MVFPTLDDGSGGLHGDIIAHNTIGLLKRHGVIPIINDRDYGRVGVHNDFTIKPGQYRRLKERMACPVWSRRRS
jgi:hypothetical protein